MRLAAAIALALAGCATESGAAPEVEPAPSSVVRLTHDEGYCSAVVISETELATARHCVRKPGVRVEGLEVVGVREHATYDVAVVEVASTLGWPVAEVARYSPSIGDELVLVGYGRKCGGFGERELVMTGYANDAHLRARGETCDGDSGGAIFDVDGGLVAIHRGHLGDVADAIDVSFLSGLRVAVEPY